LKERVGEGKEEWKEGRKEGRKGERRREGKKGRGRKETGRCIPAVDVLFMGFNYIRPDYAGPNNIG
jgi:hypothetical protein